MYYGKRVLERIRDVLAPSGWLVGSTTAVDEAQRGQGNFERYNEFAGVETLPAFTGQVFAGFRGPEVVIRGACQ